MIDKIQTNTTAPAHQVENNIVPREISSVKTADVLMSHDAQSLSSATSKKAQLSVPATPLLKDSSKVSHALADIIQQYVDVSPERNATKLSETVKKLGRAHELQISDGRVHIPQKETLQEYGDLLNGLMLGLGIKSHLAKRLREGVPAHPDLKEVFKTDGIISKKFCVHSQVFANDTTQKIYESEIEAVAKDLNAAIKSYIAASPEKHTGYLYAYAEDDKLTNYLRTYEKFGQDHIQFERLPMQADKLCELLNHILKGHSKSGSLYHSISEKLTPDHALGRLFKKDGVFSPHLTVRDTPLPKPVMLEKTPEPEVKKTQTKQIDPEKMKRLLQEQKDRISYALSVRSELLTKVQISDAIASFQIMVDNSWQKKPFEKTVVAPFQSMILQSQDLTAVKRAADRLEVENQGLITEIDGNLDPLPTSFDKDMKPLKSGASETIQTALSTLKNETLSFKDRVFRFFMPSQYAHQQSQKNQLIAQLNTVEHLRKEMIQQNGWENFDQALWFQEQVREILQQGTPDTYQIGRFKLESSFYQNWNIQLNEM
ncbi:hypothetical protein [Algicola sagamiensis]|uniref:hypothetical protein n=1 Tax=Algicola sagamiensis TaxID=163869 RepID=UPI00037BFF07|nr:hypothetical protein [Algicola sagamiensis]